MHALFQGLKTPGSHPYGERVGGFAQKYTGNLSEVGWLTNVRLTIVSRQPRDEMECWGGTRCRSTSLSIARYTGAREAHLWLAMDVPFIIPDDQSS